MAMISRNPFARQELHRSTVRVSHTATCAWCGQRREHARAGVTPNYTLFRYRVERDGVQKQKYENDKLFCSVSCRRSYYGM